MRMAGADASLWLVSKLWCLMPLLVAHSISFPDSPLPRSGTFCTGPSGQAQS